MKDQETQALVPSNTPAQKISEIKSNSLHFVFSLIGMLCILLLASSHLDRLDSLEDKIKTGILYLNLVVVYAGCIFLPSPKVTGIARYFFKLIEALAFAYFLNLVFATILVR
jgi:hypothetical protein